MLNICTVGEYWKEKFGEKVYRVGIDGGFTCPTRDGTKGTGGCYFCDEKGSRGVYIMSSDGIEKQIEAGICKLKKRGINKFVSYFQSYTGTYAPVDVLRKKYYTALLHPDVVGISVSTRPDCINKESIGLLNEIAKEYYTIVELGIQSVHQKSLDLAGRKHTVRDSKEAVGMLKKSRKIEVVAHVILGLPGETEDDMIETARVLSKWGVNGVKLHHLYIVEGTPFSKRFLKGDIKVYENPEDYAGIAKEFISNLSDSIIIHRFSGYANGERLIAPEWTRDRHIARDLILEMF
ncbi:TIGR01212 family radical SAM protein [candidate division WOR-3 bacterium]|nr:TIGR01212 family radical SAM protein [candidate division WOR-3 bacterium]